MLRKIYALALIAAFAACTPPSATAPVAETAAASIGDLAIVDAPVAGARVTSPLTITGTAPGNWYFENMFPVLLIDAQGAEIASAPAVPRVTWNENAEPKQFDATLTFSVAQDTPATLVLEEDMPHDGDEPRTVRIDVVLAAN